MFLSGTPQRGAAIIVKSSDVSQSGQSQSTQHKSQPSSTPEDEFDDFPMSAEQMDIAMQGVEESK